MDSIALPSSLSVAIARLALATLLGAVIGANRELQQKPAGLRTHALVALGAGLAALTGLYMSDPSGPGDAGAMGRVLQGVVAGVGFIGAGVILRRNDPKGVHGLTTAASIWLVACVGAAAGVGLWRLALAAVVLALLVFLAGGPLDRLLHRWQSRAHAGDDGNDD